MSNIDIKEFAKRAGVSRATIYKRIKLGELPKPRKIGAASRWPEDQVKAALDGLPLANIKVVPAAGSGA